MDIINKRVAIVTKYFFPSTGGGERQLFYFIRALSNHYQLDLFTAQQGAKLPPHIASSDISLFADEHDEINESYSRILRQVIDIKDGYYDIAYIVAYQKDAVYQQFKIIQAFKENKAKVVVRFSSYGEATEFLSKLNSKDVITQIDKIVCLSPLIKQELLNANCPEKKIYEFLNPVDISLFHPAILPFEDAHKHVVVASRPHPKKKWFEIIDAWNLSKRDGSTLTFLYNDNSSQYLKQYKNKVQRYAKNLSCYDSIEFCGDITMQELPNRLRDFDIFISASENEGMQNTLLEALATGLQIIAPDDESFDFLPPFGVLRFHGNVDSLSSMINTALISDRYNHCEIRSYLRAYHGLNNYIYLLEPEFP